MEKESSESAMNPARLRAELVEIGKQIEQLAPEDVAGREGLMARAEALKKKLEQFEAAQSGESRETGEPA